MADDRPASVHSFRSAPALRRALPASWAATLLDRPVILTACFALAVVLRAVGLYEGATTDEGYWMQRTVRFGAALARGDFEGTYRSGHPGVTVMWIGLLGIGPDRLAPLASPRYVEATVL